MLLDDHPVKQVIFATHLPSDENGNPLDYIVGKNCSRIEACSKDGLHCSLPYIRVWNGDECVAEFCQHAASFIRFSAEKLSEPDSNNLPF